MTQGLKEFSIYPQTFAIHALMLYYSCCKLTDWIKWISKSLLSFFTSHSPSLQSLLDVCWLECPSLMLKWFFFSSSVIHIYSFFLNLKLISSRSTSYHACLTESYPFSPHSAIFFLFILICSFIYPLLLLIFSIPIAFLFHVYYS